MSTIRQVAERAGVSQTTVSHVINNTRFVSEETRTRVLAAMIDLGYRPNALARSLRRGETRTIGLILPDSANPFFAEIGRAIEDAAFQQGYSVFLCNTEEDIDRERLYISVLVEKQVDGIIFVSAGAQSESFGLLLDYQLPAVLVDRDVPQINADIVLSDNFQGGLMATRHLIELGHRRIAYISGPSYLTPSSQRLVGYEEALKSAGLSLDPDLIAQGDFHPDSGCRATHDFFNLPHPPTAVFAGNDLMAMGAIRAASEAGRQVPEHLAVVGFDDIDLASYVEPPLTTVQQPKQLIGQKAFELLLQRIQAPSQPTRRELYPVKLITRSSSGGSI